MTKERVLLALFGFGLALGVLYLDYRLHTFVGSLLVITVLGALALAEFYPILARIGLPANAGYGVGAAVALFLLRGVLQWRGLAIPPALTRECLMGFLALVVMGPFLAALFRGGPPGPGGREDFERVAATLLGLLYVWFLLSFLLELRLLDDGSGTTHLGLKLTLVLVLSVKLGDSCAYLVGRSVGATPLTWVSPRKTWEGAAGSVAGAALTAVILGLLLGFSWWRMLLFGTLTNVAGQFGDLVESFLKRRAGLKDSGRFLREIGGLLDLLDSLLLASPVAYLLALLLGIGT